MQITNAKIEESILELLHQRAAGKTICPSEAARRLQPTDWGELMPRIREVADDMKNRKILVVLQKSKPIASAQEAVGPIRLRLK
jgi:hypothetical protein